MSARPRSSEAALRRLELLSAELAGVRPDPSEPSGWSAEEEIADLEPRAPSLPVPGRHAARPSRPPRRWPLGGSPGGWLRESLSLQSTHLAALALLVSLALLVGAWWVVRSGGSSATVPPATLAAPLTPVAGLATPSGPLDPSPTSSGTPSGTVVVDVTGRVRHPGIVVLELGDRVVDALKAAGGALRGTDLSTLNQARVLVDGEQIVVGAPAVPGVAASASAASAPAAPLVNLNTATEAELESLPGIGPVTAQSILEWREANGRFTSVEELLEVDGIGDATLADLAPYVTL